MRSELRKFFLAVCGKRTVVGQEWTESNLLGSCCNWWFFLVGNLAQYVETYLATLSSTSWPLFQFKQLNLCLISVTCPSLCISVSPTACWFYRWCLYLAPHCPMLREAAKRGIFPFVGSLYVEKPIDIPLGKRVTYWGTINVLSIVSSQLPIDSKSPVLLFPLWWNSPVPMEEAQGGWVCGD